MNHHKRIWKNELTEFLTLIQFFYLLVHGDYIIVISHSYNRFYKRTNSKHKL